MKHIYYPKKRSHFLSFMVSLLVLLLPLDLRAQSGGTKNDIYITTICTEYKGDGVVVAHFGYENRGKKTVVIDETGSVVTYNHGQAKKYGIYTFEPGVNEDAFTQEFDSKDRVQWTVYFSNGDSTTTDANINSNHCRDAQTDLNIIPGYIPPEGGKEYNSKIGAALTSLAEKYNLDPGNFFGTTDEVFQIRGTEVLIEANSYNGTYNAMLYSLDSLGFDLVSSDPGLKRTTGWVEIGDLLTLNSFSNLDWAQNVVPGIHNSYFDLVPPTGVVKSQGDFAMHSDFARLGYDIDGSGVKVGVMSNSYNTLGDAYVNVQNGDLPGSANPDGDSIPVDVIKDVVLSSGSLSDEGRAMLQIVHDVAPGAELAFRTGYLGEQDMARGIREMADSGVNIIVDDLSYVTEPFFRDGVISQTIDSVVSEGVTFFSSAGNFGRSAYTDTYNPTTAPSTITGTAHNFDGVGDIFQKIRLLKGSYTLVLQWDDGSDPTMNTTATDLDIFLSDDAGFSLLGFNRENIGKFPIEVVPFSVLLDTVYSNIVVARAAGPDVPVTFKYMLFRGGSIFETVDKFENQSSSTIVGHPNAAGAIAVGAVRFDKNPVWDPIRYSEPVIMSFSSVGGTPVSGIVRDKPDITAPNGVNTTIFLGKLDENTPNGDWNTDTSIYPYNIDPDIEFPNFFGTSAASPHAAGVAALIMQAKAKYDSVSYVSPDTIRSLLRKTALYAHDDTTGMGYNYVSGDGFIQAHKAIMEFANPKPSAYAPYFTSGGELAGEVVSPVSFTIPGDFFTDSTQVYFRGEPLDTGVVVVDESTITVNHEGFLGNPELQVYNPVISSSELDGGFSEPVYLSDSVKQRVVITANNLTKKFGEVIPADSASIMVITADDDTLSLEQAVLDTIMTQAEADRLSGLSFSTPARDTSIAGLYIIEPSLDPVLDVDNPLTELDQAITEKFILQFVNGTLTIEKLALKITPMDTSIVYGEQLPPGGFQYLFEIGDSSVVITNPDSILQSVQQEYTAALSNEIGLVRGVALVNGIPVIRSTALVNGVTMIKGTALVNGIEVKVEIVDSDTTVYVAGEPVVNGGTLVRGVALVNDRPFVSMTEIIRGVALVNGDQVTFENGYMTELNGVSTPGVLAVRGTPLVNGGTNIRGVALVNGHTVVVENGITSIDGVAVPNAGIVEINGIPVIRGTALVNSSTISRGVALVNGLEVVIENGYPTGRGIALVNGSPSLRGIALVNGIPLYKGTALVNNLEVNVFDGEVTQVYASGVLVNSLSVSRGLALVNDVPLVNGGELLSRGTALVNGIMVPDENGNADGEDVVNLENMNFLASATAIANGLNSVRGTPLVNGIEGEDGEALRLAAGTIQDDGSIVYESSITSRGVALVNGYNYVRGTALVNGSPLDVRGTALVNGSTVNENSNSASIIVFDATEIGDTTENVGFTPVSFITGTTVGQQTIVPGTLVSTNKFNITYGLGTLTIEPAELTIAADDKNKVYGEADPELTFTESGLLGEDTIAGALIREGGEDVGEYDILQGSVNAGYNYTILYDTATFTITQRALEIEITAADKVYDGTTTAATTAFVEYGLVDGDDITVSSQNGLFDSKNVGTDKLVTADVSVTGIDAPNYLANVTADTTADITALGINVTAVADSKVYDGTTVSAGVPVVDPLADGDEAATSPVQVFDDRNAGTGKTLSASGLAINDGNDGNNYAVSYVDVSTGEITPLGINVTAVTDSKVYDGSTSSDGEPVVDPLMAGDVVSTDPVQVFDNRNTGTGKTLSASGLVIDDGNEANNYSVNYVDVNTGVITALGINVTAVTDSKVYDGTTGSAGEPVVDPLVNGDVVTTEPVQVFDNRNAGTGKTISANGLVIDDGNGGGNYDVSYVDVGTGQISALPINVTAVTDSKLYDGTTSSAGEPVVDPLVSGDLVTAEPVQVFDNKNTGTGKTLSASGLAIDDGNGGGNYDVSYVDVNTGEISALPVNVTAVSDSKEYDGTTSSDESPAVDALMAGDVVSTDPVQVFDNKNVGTGKTLSASGLVIDDGNAGNNYLVTYVDDHAGEITPKSVTVTPTDPILYIWEGDPLPVFAFIYNGWITGDAGNEGYTVLRDSDGAAYDPLSGESAGTYTVTPAPSNGNYSYDFESGTLYVNPNDNNTKAVKPVLNCIEEISDGYYVANFEYKNDNSDNIYVPWGPDNILIGDSIDWEHSDLLPELFLSGGGSFHIFYWDTGTGISWEVSTLDKKQKVRNGANANSSSTKCTGNPKSASVSAEVGSEVPAPDQLLAYPNPVGEKVYLSMKDIENYKMIQLYDFAGRSFPINSIVKRTDNLEIDMAQLSAGHYFIRVVMEDSAKVVQIVKQ